MVSWLLLALPLSATAVAARDKLHGVHPKSVSKYTPSKSNTWTCLDGSKEISWNAVNDDYCDCADGSDEPGTSACPNSRFWCKNVGHIGSFIPSSRVGDGLCELSCCDGSDEAPGVCPNKCKEVGEAYRAKRDAELKIQKTGSKIRSSYIVFAHKEKKRLEELTRSLEKDIAVKEMEVEKLRDIAERTESLSQAALEHKKQSPLYQSLLNHNKALKSLKHQYKKHADREKQLGDILDALRRNYNPNYQDMGVLEAVRGWEELAGLPHINDVKKEGGEEVVEEAQAPAVDDAVNAGDLYSPEELEGELDDILRTDYTALLLEHEEHISAPTEDTLIYKIASYIPESWLPAYENVKDQVLDWLEKLGIVPEDSSDGGATNEATRAQQAHARAQAELDQMKSDKAEADQGVGKIFNPEHFGVEGEWKKLDDTCVEHNAGDYTYELCFFGEAKQKPNKGGQTFSLGRFKSWNTDAPVGTPEYYSKQVYLHGTRCWNGPERNVKILLECGTENALTSVQELEKCEYQFTGTSPALCLPPGKEVNHEEL